MKSIESLGGPLIGLDLEHLHLWSGIDGKSFIGESSPFPHDYEAAGDLTAGRNHPPCDITKIVGTEVEALLITTPDRTAVVGQDDEGAYIAQVEAAEPGWDFDQVERAAFDRAVFDPREDVRFSCPSACTLVFFDAAFPGNEITDDCLTVDLSAGDYVFSTARYDPDENTWLILCKLTRTKAP